MLRTIGAVVAACLMIAFGVGHAFALNVSDFIDPVRPFILEITSVVIAGFVGFVARKVSAWTGIEIESRHREALQSALENGARLIIDAIGSKVGAKGVDLGNGTLNAGVDYVLKSVPDAVQHFGLDRKRISDLLRPKLIPKA